MPEEARPPLTEPLPSAVFGGSGGLFSGYRSYPAFSAPWFWRRTAIFGPMAAAIALLQALLLGLGFHDSTLALVWTIAGIPIWITLVTAGPAFATLVRHRRLPPRIERVAVVAGILAGVVVSCAAQYAAEVLSRETIGARLAGHVSSILGEPAHPPGTTFFVVLWTSRVAIFLCLGGGLTLRTYFREQRLWSEAQHERQLTALRREKNEADLRLTVLQAQVEPHFLFNTLASVHSLIRKDPDRAEATLEALADHLRATLPRLRADIGRTDSTLDQQIDICTSYLALMQVRLGSRLRYTIEVPVALRQHPFPPLLLISLVENAIKHGIEPSATGGNVMVTADIEAHAGERRLAVSVVDDGVGLRAEIGGGMGLRNIREQLGARFGSEATLLVRGRTVGGVAATVRVPYLEP